MSILYKEVIQGKIHMLGKDSYVKECQTFQGDLTRAVSDSHQSLSLNAA